MQDTVDQAYGAVPRTLANIIEDARRAAGEADARPLGVWRVPGHSGEFGVARCSTLSDRLDQLVPAEDGEAAVAFRTAGDLTCENW